MSRKRYQPSPTTLGAPRATLPGFEYRTHCQRTSTQETMTGSTRPRDSRGPRKKLRINPATGAATGPAPKGAAPRRLPAYAASGALVSSRTSRIDELKSAPMRRKRPLERCRSGRTGRSRKPLYARAYRGFESHPLRQAWKWGLRGPFFVLDGAGFEPTESTRWFDREAVASAANPSHPLRQARKRGHKDPFFVPTATSAHNHDNDSPQRTVPEQSHTAIGTVQVRRKETGPRPFPRRAGLRVAQGAH